MAAFTFCSILALCQAFLSLSEHLSPEFLLSRAETPRESAVFKLKFLVRVSRFKWFRLCIFSAIADLCVRFVRRIAQLSLWAVSLLIYACGSCVE